MMHKVSVLFNDAAMNRVNNHNLLENGKVWISEPWIVAAKFFNNKTWNRRNASDYDNFTTKKLILKHNCII